MPQSVRALFLAAGVLAAAACTVGGDRAPAAPTAEAPTEAPPAKALIERWRAKPPAGSRVIRIWATDTIVVVVTRSGVKGFDAATGALRWELRGPSGPGGGSPCAASSEVNGQGLGAVLYDRGYEEYGDFGGCGVLMVPDTRNGKVQWRADLPNRDGSQADYPDVGADAVTIGDDVIGVRTKDGEPGQTLHRYSVDGERLPRLRVPGGEECRRDVSWTQSATYTLARSACDDATRISLFRTQSGAELWTRPKPAELSLVSGIAAGDPPTVAGGRHLVSFTGTGEVPADVSLPHVARSAPLRTRGSLAAVAMGNEPHEAAFAGADPRSGRLLWQVELHGGVPAGVHDGDLLAVYLHPPERSHRLVRLDARDGTRTEVGVLPEDVSELVDVGAVPEAAVAGDTLYVVASTRLFAYRIP